MTPATPREPWERLEALLAAGDAHALQSFLDTLPPAEAGRALSRLDDEVQGRLLALLDPEAAAHLLEPMSDTQAADLIEELPPAQAAGIVEELPSADQADVLGELDHADAEAILARMEPEDAAGARRLMQYAADTAGGIMITEYLAFPEHWTVADVTGDLRTHGAQYSDFDVQYTYVTSADGALVGVLRVRDLLLARGDEPVNRIMIPSPLSVDVRTSLQPLEQLFDEHAFLGMPVVDAQRRLVGVVRRAAVEEALRDQATATFLKFSGLIGEDELRTMPLGRRASRRLSWLSINIVLNILAASVIALYQDTLAAVIALAVFLPIISDMSGCSGNQAVAVSIRELSLGLVKPYEFLRVALKEGGIGLINGLALGVLLGGVAFAWKGNTMLGLVVGGALMLNTCVAVLLGGLIPLGLKRLRLDPALASGPILTTVTDMCGFFLVLSFATAVLPRLAP